MVLMDFGSFSHLLKKFSFFIFKKCSKWVIFEQKAWAIAHGFDGFWVFFTPFGKIYAFFKKCSKWVIFEQKAWTIAHGFDGFWVFFTPFGKFIHFSKNVQKSWVLGHFWAKSMGYSPWFWWILGVFHTFWENLCIFQKMFKNGSFLSKKHGL